eukprot:TRINITY_DN3304_c0_g1_i11.p1 TRINITY_DN3304_c0_g1~~TRINITY_DN3304_c0_g1_i11.p1  ORF type:complete len:101 (+),score=5.56 TRINITY_DN3304_c0_g1_i11:254-556(+)
MSDERLSHDVTTDVHDEVARLEQRLSQLEERLRTQKDECEEKLRVQKDEYEESTETTSTEGSVRGETTSTERGTLRCYTRESLTRAETITRHCHRTSHTL